MWARKKCGICKANFGVHPRASTFNTRQLCIECRKISWQTKYGLMAKASTIPEYKKYIALGE